MMVTKRVLRAAMVVSLPGLLAACGSGTPSITYEVSGTGGEAFVEYGPADTITGREGMTVTLPWTLTVEVQPGDSFAVHVADVGDAGRVRCSVRRGDTVIGSAEGEVFAACTGSIYDPAEYAGDADSFTGLSDTFPAEFALPVEAIPDGPPSLIFLGDEAESFEIQVYDEQSPFPAPLTESFPGRCPVWSPDGTRLAFGSGGSVRALYVMDATTGAITRLTDPAAVVPDYCAAWSPDGAQLVFGGVPAAAADDPSHLYIAAADGSGVRRLTNNSEAEVGYRTPSWAPDGSRIAFVSSMPGPSDAEPIDDAIMAIAPDGSGLTLIGDPVDTIADLDWSPAGDQLLFVCRAADVAVQRSGLCLMSADGSSQRNLTDGTYTEMELGDWSAAGDAVLFVARRNSQRSILMLTLDGLLYRIWDVNPFAMDAYNGFVEAYPAVARRYDRFTPIPIALPD